MTASSPKLEGFRGWLLFVGIGLVVRPIALLTNELPAVVRSFTDGTWQSHTTLGSPAYHPLSRYSMGMQLVGNLGVLLVELWLLVLFYRRSPRFPRWYIAWALFMPVFILTDAWLITRIAPAEPLWDPVTTRNFIGTAVGALIWVPYMLVSKRVKATFVAPSAATAVTVPQAPG